MTHCPNCEADVALNYCARCGQRLIDLDRPFVALLSEVLRETFDLDGRAARTGWALLRRPGLLTREFLAGRRRRYTPPLRLYLVVSLGFFIVAAWAVGRGVLLEPGQGTGEAQRQAAFLSEVLPKVMFVLLPVFALLLRALFPTHLYFSHLIHALHAHTLAYVVLAFVLPLERDGLDAPFLAGLQFVLVAYLVTWVLLSIRAVYGQSWLRTVLKAGVLVVAYLGMVTATAKLFGAVFGI